MFVLDDRSVFIYLVDQKILRKEDCAEYQALPLDGRNFSLAIEAISRGTKKRSLIVKQTPIDESADGDLPFLGEQILSQLLQQFESLQPLQDYVVLLDAYDVNNRIVVAEFLGEYQDLAAYYDETAQFLPEIAQSLGKVLAQFHRSTLGRSDYQNFLADYDPDLIDPELPEHWGELPLLTPADLGQWRQDALEFFRLYQADGALQQSIAQLQLSWQSCCLTHQDLRLANWLVHRTDRAQPPRLIDWEALQWGDPLADLGNLLAEYLCCWLGSLDPQPGLPLPLVLRQATVPLEQLQPSLRAIVSAYIQEFPAVTQRYEHWLLQLLGWTGRALLYTIQVHLEYYQPFDRRQRMTYQVAKQLITQPQSALVELFGSPTWSGVASD
jgi:hypothetical protein